MDTAYPVADVNDRISAAISAKFGVRKNVRAVAMVASGFLIGAGDEDERQTADFSLIWGGKPENL
jgi:hypothetical protein